MCYLYIAATPLQFFFLLSFITVDRFKKVKIKVKVFHQMLVTAISVGLIKRKEALKSAAAIKCEDTLRYFQGQERSRIRNIKFSMFFIPCSGTWAVVTIFFYLLLLRTNKIKMPLCSNGSEAVIKVVGVLNLMASFIVYFSWLLPL